MWQCDAGETETPRQRRHTGPLPTRKASVVREHRVHPSAARPLGRLIVEDLQVSAVELDTHRCAGVCARMLWRGVRRKRPEQDEAGEAQYDNERSHLASSAPASGLPPLGRGWPSMSRAG